MSVADTAAALASSGLNEAQQIKILMLKGVGSEEAATMVQTYGFVAAESAATAETNILSSSMTGLKTALHGLKAAFMSNPIGFVVTAAVTVISILVSLSNTIQGASEKLEISIHTLRVEGDMYCKQYYVDNEKNLILVSANPRLKNANVFVSADSTSEVRCYGKVLLDCKIALPEYLFGQ